MDKSPHTLLLWIEIQSQNIEKTQAMIEQAILLCNQATQEEDISSLEIIVSNIVMHIEQLVQYKSCIVSLMSSSNQINELIEYKYAETNQQLEHVAERFAVLEYIATQNLKDLHNKLQYAQSFISQMLAVH